MVAGALGTAGRECCGCHPVGRAVRGLCNGEAGFRSRQGAHGAHREVSDHIPAAIARLHACRDCHRMESQPAGAAPLGAVVPGVRRTALPHVCGARLPA